MSFTYKTQRKETIFIIGSEELAQEILSKVDQVFRGCVPGEKMFIESCENSQLDALLQCLSSDASSLDPTHEFKVFWYSMVHQWRARSKFQQDVQLSEKSTFWSDDRLMDTSEEIEWIPCLRTLVLTNSEFILLREEVELFPSFISRDETSVNVSGYYKLVNRWPIQNLSRIVSPFGQLVPRNLNSNLGEPTLSEHFGIASPRNFVFDMFCGVSSCPDAPKNIVCLCSQPLDISFYFCGGASNIADSDSSGYNNEVILRIDSNVFEIAKMLYYADQLFRFHILDTR